MDSEVRHKGVDCGQWLDSGQWTKLWESESCATGGECDRVFVHDFLQPVCMRATSWYVDR